MKKIINLKETIIILIAVMLVTVCATTVNAIDPTNLIDNNNVSTITGDEYNNVQTIPDDENIIDNNTDNNTTNNAVNNATNNNSVKKYNTNNTTDLPQTGIEDYNIGILLIICVASAIFAYKKVSDYRNI